LTPESAYFVLSYSWLESIFLLHYSNSESLDDILKNVILKIVLLFSLLVPYQNGTSGVICVIFSYYVITAK
ncbi:TPA: hypothetical protein ACIWGM_004535, partial [Salmonella enterica subsp. enterica serovar Enteritidis]